MVTVVISGDNRNASISQEVDYLDNILQQYPGYEFLLDYYYKAEAGVNFETSPQTSSSS